MVFPRGASMLLIIAVVLIFKFAAVETYIKFSYSIDKMRKKFRYNIKRMYKESKIFI